MINYVPFLKLKANEVGALKVLAPDIKERLIPFFDLVKKDNITVPAFEKMVEKSAASLARNLDGIDRFFLDNFDIDDRLIVNKSNNYALVIEKFDSFNFIPVVGLDRAPERNRIVYDYKAKGKIKSDAIAIRLVAEDFESFKSVRTDLEDLVRLGDGLFTEWILILDNRVCMGINASQRAMKIVQFIEDLVKGIDFDFIVIAGSSIPSSIRDVLRTESDTTQRRSELQIYREVSNELDRANLYLGDYTIVSPLYSDLDVPPEVMLNVMAPKVVYTHGRVHYIARGGALKVHPRKNLQYNDIAKQIVAKPFYRGRGYSFGDEFLYEKSRYHGSGVTPSSILKPTINTHITYMVRDFVT